MINDKDFVIIIFKLLMINDNVFVIIFKLLIIYIYIYIN